MLKTDPKNNETILNYVPHANENIRQSTDLLHEKYKNEREKDSKETWGAYCPETVVKVLQVSHKQKHVTKEQTEAVTKVSFRGRLHTWSTEILDKYVSFYYIDTFFNNIVDSKEDSPTGNIILIEGAPGVGKTVLSREIAFKWADEQILLNNPLLFLMHLHHPEIPQIKSLREFVGYAISSEPEGNLVKLTAEHLDNFAGRGCTIVFDGYDEITQSLKEKSFIAKIINRDMLPFCNWVITSRPTASIDLCGRVDYRIEILGFTEAKKNEYISKNISHREETERLQEHFKQNPFINDLCCIPLNMTILLRVFQEQHELPETQTDFNSQFIYITISRFLSKVTRESITIKSPDDLTEPYKQQFSSLCKLAYNLLHDEKVVFSDNDILKYDSIETSTNWKTLGLLKEVYYYTFKNNELIKSYSFLHLSMQECLAAHFIASSKQTEEKFLRKYFWDLRYLNTGVMYVGLTEGKSKAFKNFLTKYKGSGLYFKLFGSDMAASHDKVKKLHLFNCLLEANNDALCESLQVSHISQKKIIDLSNHVLQPKDIHTLSLFLARSSIKHWNKLDLSNCFVIEENLNNFLSVVSKSIRTKVTIDIIDISGTKLLKSVNTIIGLINYFEVKKLVIAESVAENLAFRKLLIFNITNVSKNVLISSSKNVNHFLINGTSISNDDMNQNMPSQHEAKVYIWNAYNTDLLNSLLSKFNIMNVYEEDVPDQKIVTIVSKLDEIIHAEKNKTITYLLHSTDMMCAYGAEFYQIARNFKNRWFTQYGHATLRQCHIKSKDFNEVFNNIHFNKLEVSQSNLAISAILECCTINNLIMSHISISNEEACDYILHEINTNGCKILNFMNGIPLMLCINDATNIFFVNCGFNDSTVQNYDAELVNSTLCFSAINLNEKNISLLLKYCKNDNLQISLFERNIENRVLDNILLKIKQLDNKSFIYVLTSNTKLVAHKAKQQQIMEAIITNQACEIVTLELMNCEIYLAETNCLGNILSNSSRHSAGIELSVCNMKDKSCEIYLAKTDREGNILSNNSHHSEGIDLSGCNMKDENNEIYFSKINRLGNILSNNSRHWELIDLSGCNIKDEGLLIIYECFSASKNVIHIKELKLSSNHLMTDSVITTLKMFECCIIKVLILSGNDDIRGDNFDTELQMHLLQQKHFMNFECKIPLIVHEGSSIKAPYEMCNVYAFETSDMRSFKSHIYKDKTQYNLYHVCIDQARYKCNLVFSMLVRRSILTVTELKEGYMNHIIMIIITEVNKLQYDEYSNFSLVDFSPIYITYESCRILCHSLFNEKTFKFIEKLEFSTCKFSLDCVPIIIEALQYCVIKEIILPCTEILNAISQNIFQVYQKEKKILNFSKKTPLTLTINPIALHTEEENSTTSDIAGDTYLANCDVTEESFKDLIIYHQITSLHNFILFNCIIANESTLTSILNVSPFIKICIFERTLSGDSFLTSLNHLGTYGDRIQYVLAAGTKIVAYKAQSFQIVKALKIQLFTCDIRITHCSIFKEDMRSIASYLISKKNVLKNIKITDCKIKETT